jgi:methyltransferase (TIGR00027 family)
MESSRSDALFHDPLAAGLAGERGLRIARTRPDGAWVVAIRTGLIDAFIRSAISSGIDTVINLGAGMDTRPYRMDLPPSVHWVEVDHPSLIESKSAQLSTEVPACSIERVGLDLADRDARRGLFDRIWTTSTMAMVLTEGVLGDLSVDEAGALADDLRAQPGCESWVIDYFSPRLIRAYQKHQPHPKVPVRFDPPSWETFFTEHGWRIKEIRFLGEESERLHRPIPLSPLDRSCVCSRLDRSGTWATRGSSGFIEWRQSRLRETVASTFRRGRLVRVDDDPRDRRVRDHRDE